MRSLLVAICVLLGLYGRAFGLTLWYGGDWNSVGGISNGVATRADGKVYDDFEVTSSEGWLVREVWSNNLFSSMLGTEAEVEIRSGVRSNDGGILVFAARAASRRVRTGRSGFGLDEYEVRIPGLSVYLPRGVFFLNVAPVSDGTGQAFSTTTYGANGVGQPRNNGNSFYDSRFYGYDFEPIENIIGEPRDFSMGVAGDVVPEPASAIALSGGFLLLARPRLRRVRGPEAQR